MTTSNNAAVHTTCLSETTHAVLNCIWDGNGVIGRTVMHSFSIKNGDLSHGTLCGVSPSFEKDAPWTGYILPECLPEVLTLARRIAVTLLTGRDFYKEGRDLEKRIFESEATDLGNGSITSFGSNLLRALNCMERFSEEDEGPLVSEVNDFIDFWEAEGQAS